MNKLFFLILFFLLAFKVEAYTFTNGDLKLDANGYIGYKFIGATTKHSVLPSEPELGLALSAQYGNHLSFYTQFAYDVQIERALVYSFAAYDIQFENEINLTLKAGKLRHPYGLYNAARINPRTRPGIILPQAIYWDSLNHLLTSGVGVGFDTKWRNIELGYEMDNPGVGNPKDEALVWSGGLLKETDTTFGSHQSAYVKYNFSSIPATFKSSWMRINLGNKTAPIASYLFPQIANKDNIANMFINSVEFNPFDKFTFTGESLFVKTPINFNNDFTKWSNGYSFTGKYELTDKINVYANYNYYQSQHIPFTPEQKWQYQNTTDVSIGINYHENKWQVGAEIHKIQGGRWANPNDYFSDPNSFKNWYMIGVNFAYFF